LSLGAHKIGSNGMNATSRSGNEVDRALASVKRALAQLINLLKSPDEAVRAGAADALRGLDPPPVWDLIGALIKARDTRFRVEIIRVLGGLGEGYRVHVTVALAQLWQGGDPAIRSAIVEAVLTMGPASSD
jgi:HEAT repeat protein